MCWWRLQRIEDIEQITDAPRDNAIALYTQQDFNYHDINVMNLSELFVVNRFSIPC